MARPDRTPSATQREVARRLGIGQRTVSRAFGASGYISDEMRQRVLEAARELGYRPNVGARAMRTGRFDTVVLLQGAQAVLGSLSIPLLDGIQDALAVRNMELTLARLTDRFLAGEDELPKTLRERTADGLLVKYDTDTPRRVQTVIARSGMPAVWINSRRSSDCVRPDDRQGGRLATELLLARGHRRIAYVDICMKHAVYLHYCRPDRFAGYKDAMRAAGLEPIPVTPERYPSDAELEAIGSSLARGRAPATALVAYSLDDATMVRRGIERATGSGDPGQIDVVHVSTTRIADSPHTTSVCCDEHDLGAASVEMLLQKIDRGGRHAPRVLPFRPAAEPTAAPGQGPATRRGKDAS